MQTDNMQCAAIPNTTARHPAFSVEYYPDGTVEVYVHTSLTIANRYAHLTQLLHDLRGDPYWRVVRMTTPNAGGSCVDLPSPPVEEAFCTDVEFVGNLTAAVPELMHAYTTARFRLVPADSNNVAYANTRTRSYDFNNIDQARFEAERIRLTHEPGTVCFIDVNHLQCTKTTTNALSDALETTYSDWRDAADMSMIELTPTITITVQNEKTLLELNRHRYQESRSGSGNGNSNDNGNGNATDANSLTTIDTRNFEFMSEMNKCKIGQLEVRKRARCAKDAPTADTDADQYFTNVSTIKYIPPVECERQNETQAIYKERGVKLFQRSNSRGPSHSISGIYKERPHVLRAVLHQEQPQHQAGPTLGQVVQEVVDVQALRTQVEEQAKLIERLQQQQYQQQQQQQEPQQRYPPAGPSPPLPVQQMMQWGSNPFTRPRTEAPTFVAPPGGVPKVSPVSPHSDRSWVWWTQ